MSSAIVTTEHGVLPLGPIEQPRNIFIRWLHWAMRRRYGRVPMVFRVVYTRSPFLAVVSMVMIVGVARFVRINRELAFLLQAAVALRVGCTFCADLHLAEAVRARIGVERFRDLADFASSPSFSPREKAALAYAQAVHQTLHVPDDVWERLEQHFSERERMDIVWLCAVERYFNSIALPLRIGSDHLAEGQ
jgi:AhpD family alkylhydroperoxidase